MLSAPAKFSTRVTPSVSSAGSVAVVSAAAIRVPSSWNRGGRGLESISRDASGEVNRWTNLDKKRRLQYPYTPGDMRARQ